MAIEYKWKVVNLERDATTGAVIRVHWDCIGVDEELEISARIYGSQDFDADEGDSSFIPFEQLTEEQVLNWLWNPPSTVDKDLTENLIAAEIENLKVPPVVSGLPW